ncbi:MAG TPA: hypothetical protein PKN52_01405 [Trueperaceae bacterium]|nr:hypothetical protein [Trueperaceae bacterium]
MRIRPFEPDDAAGVASLWQYWFRGKTRVPDPGLVELVRRMYVEYPSVDAEVRPLVAEDERGKLLGFLGVTAMPVMVDGEERTMAGIFPSVVDPEAPTTVAAFLLRKFLAGPQVFTISDGGHVKFERIWELLGGSIAQMQSLRWVKVFRPGALGLEVVADRNKVLRALAPLLGPIVRGGDVAARHLARSRLVNGPVANYRSEPLTPGALARHAPELLGHSRLWPVYSDRHVAWQFEQMARIVQQGGFRARIVMHGEEVVGWYIYYLRKGGICRLFDLEATPNHMDAVVGQLFAEADEVGAGALIGRMEPRLRGSMNRHGALVHNGGSLLMVHSKDPSLVTDALLGRLAFSRLQGENWYWWAINSRVVP